MALKVLPPGLLGDEAARGRFRKEGKALSRLSHPHVATLLDSGTADGIDFLVMELVSGPALDMALRGGPLGSREVVRLGAQLARGLAAAHGQGIVHRDLKPSNLCLTEDGLLKILDFGLAHLVPPQLAEQTQATPTETAAGRVVGSPPYMSPEQLVGKEADARSDVYSAGACLYELATGKRPFGERNGARLVDAILHEAPEPAGRVKSGVSAGLESVIAKAMDKDPRLRYQTARELLVDLERLQVVTTSGPASAPVPAVKPRRRRWPWFVAAAASVLLVVVGAWLLRPAPPPRITNVRRLRLDLGFFSDSGLISTWATDGVRLYYVAKKQAEYRLLQVPATGGEPSEIEIPPGLRRGFEIYGFLPRQSALLCLAAPDKSGGGWPVWTVPVPHGTPRRLGDLVANTAGASPDGEQIALLQIAERRLVLARADGSGARLLVQVPPPSLGVTWAPDGRRIRFAASLPLGPQAESWIWETTVAGEAPRPLWPGQAGRWTRDGRYFVFERRDESAMRYDVFAVQDRAWPPWARAQPVRLTSGPLSFIQVGPAPDGGGLLAFGADRRGELLRYDPVSRSFAGHLEGASIVMVDVSRDGEWLAWTTWPEGVLWRSRADGSQKLQLSATGLRADLPRWSPDGKRIAFTGQQAPGGALSISLVSADGGAVEVLAAPAPGLDHWDVCWLPDGDSVLFSYLQQERPGLFRVDLGTRQVSQWLGAERLQYPKCSPQGRVFAMELLGPDSAAARRASLGYWVFLPERGTWEEVAVPGPVYANWTRDGQSLIGFNLEGSRIERFSLATRHSEVIADVRSLALARVPGSPRWMGLDATDAPLVTRDASTFDLYALDWEAP